MAYNNLYLVYNAVCVWIINTLTRSISEWRHCDLVILGILFG